jgi:uncharacterized protein (TIGR02099 family)
VRSRWPSVALLLLVLTLPSAPANAPAAAFVERRRHRALRWSLRIAFGMLFGAWSLLLLAWLTLHWGILPRIEQWRPQIEARASQALGVPVAIGAIQVRSSGWVPAFELSDVVLKDRQQHEALRLPKVSAALSARSLLAFELRFEQLHIEGAALEIRRAADGRIFVAGIEVPPGGADASSGAADWFFSQHEFVVRNGRLRWVDEQRQALPLELEQVDLVVRNGFRRHAMRLDATPPLAWGERFSVQGRFTQSLLDPSGDWRRWDGSLHLALPRTDVAELRQHVSLPFEVGAGEGALRAWIDVRRGQPQAAMADLALRSVVVRLAPTVEPLAFAEVQGRLSAERSGDTLKFAAAGLGFTTADGVVWPRINFTLALRQKPGSAPSSPLLAGGELTADRLDLGAMAQVARHVPLGAALAHALTELAPSGQVNALAANWDGALEAPLRYKVKARVAGLSIAAAPSPEAGGVGRPGWRNASIELDATEAGGKASLALDKGALILPGVFEPSELTFDSLSTQMSWRVRAASDGVPPALELALKETKFANSDAQGELSLLHWQTGAGASGVHGRGARLPGRLELAGSLSRGRAAAVARYLPLGVDEQARRYVQHAVLDGRVAGASFKLSGDLWDFPFGGTAPAGAGARASGEFRVSARAEDVTLAYVPGDAGAASQWPSFTRVHGELVFDRRTMEIRNAGASVYGVELGRVNGSIPDLMHPVLRIDGQARGPLSDLIRYAEVTPIGEWTGHALRPVTATGPAELSLKLEIPIDDAARSTVQGRVTLAGNDLRLSSAMPLLAGTKARVDFNRQGFAIIGGSARVLGGDTTFDGGAQADGSQRFVAQGVVSAEALRRAPELGALSRVAALLTGQTPYRLTLGLVRGRSEFSLTSPLTGLAIDLPAPLKKSAELAWPLRVESRLATAAGVEPARDSLRVDLGSVVQAQYQRDLSRDTPQVLRGALAVLDGLPPLPERGVHAVLNLATVDADAWQAVLDRWQASATAGVTPAAGDDGYLPRTVALRATALSSGGRRLTRLVAGISQDSDDATWRGSLDADQLGGYVEYRAAQGPANAGRVYARLARLALPPSDADSVENLLVQAPASVPALDIVVDDFELRGKKFGRVEIEAANRAVAGGGREWRMSRFAVSNPDAVLTGTGRWQPGTGEGRQRMVMDFRLDLANSGAALERMGQGGTLQGGKGRMTGQLEWDGSPLSLHVPSLDGRINLALDAGQFLKAGPGAARLLSVLNLQALPRRLMLDFRDLFQEGFAFDNVTGDVSIADGVASTNNLRMRGVQAAVLMEGRADIAHETQDLRVLVVPEINAGTASLAYAVINPAVGLGAFAAQWFLRRPLMAASTREFSVQGSWAEPKVERVERKFDAPLPEIDAPAAASAPGQ